MPRRKPKEVTVPQEGKVEQFRQAFEKSRREVLGEIDDIADQLADVPAGGTAAGADEPFVTHAAAPLLTSSRRLVNGANTTVNTAVAGQIAIDVAAGAPTDAQYVTLATNATLTAERVLTAGHGVDITDNGAGSTVVVDVDETELSAATIGGFDEAAQDAVGNILTATTSIIWQYNDAAPTIAAAIEDEYVQDLVGAMVTAGHGIDVAYNDGAGTETIDVDESELSVPLHTNVADETLVDIDCTAEATNDWNAGGDGTYTLGGFNWTIVNTVSVDTFGPVVTTGVRVNLSAVAATTYTTATRSAPYFRIATTTLIPTWDPLGTYVIEVYLSSVTFGTSGDRIVIFLDYDWSGTDRMFAAGRRNASGTQQTYATIDAASSITGSDVTHDAIALRVNPAGCAGLSGAYAAGFPLYTVVGGYQPSVATVGSAMHPSSFIGLAFMNGGAGGAMDCTVARIRVRRVRG